MRKLAGRKLIGGAVAALALSGLFGAALGVSEASAAVGITNGDFETGTLTGWTTSGTTSATSPGRSGVYAGQAGAVTPTKGASVLKQTFTVPTGATKLSVWYLLTCNSSSDYFSASLSDGTTKGTVTLASKLCTKNYTWTELTATVVAGKTYTLTLTNYDDNKAATPTYTQIDDVTLI